MGVALLHVLLDGVRLASLLAGGEAGKAGSSAARPARLAGGLERRGRSERCANAPLQGQAQLEVQHSSFTARAPRQGA